jgi:hypothetical protein
VQYAPPPPTFTHSSGDSCRAKEAVAAKATAEQELRAVSLQLETALARAQECEEKERLAVETCAQHKVSCILGGVGMPYICFASRLRSAPPDALSQATASDAAHKLAEVERERDAARHR